MKKVIFVLVLLLIPKTIVKAECFSEEIVKEKVYLNRLASNLDISSFYEENEAGVNFSVRVANLHPKLRVYEEEKNITINYGTDENTPKELIISGYESGDGLKFDIFAQETNCINEEIIITKYLTLPNYNPFYKDPLCSDYPGFPHCKKWSNVFFGYETFLSRMDDYIKNLEKVETEVEIKEEKDLFEIVTEFILNNHRYILGGILVISISGIIIESRKRKDLF